MATKRTILEIARRGVARAKRRPPTTLFDDTNANNLAVRTLLDEAGQELLDVRNSKSEPFTALKKNFTITLQTHLSLIHI